MKAPVPASEYFAGYHLDKGQIFKNFLTGANQRKNIEIPG